MRFMNTIIRLLSGLCLLAIGVGMLSKIEVAEHLALQVSLSVIAMVAAALGVYVLVGGRRRGTNRGGDDDSA